MAAELATRGIRCEWIGRRNAAERRWVADAGLRFHAVPAGKLRRYFSLRTAIDLFAVVAGLVASWWCLLRMRPAALLVKGGFVSLPPAVAAWVLGIPVLVHESDASPGLATRLASYLAERVLLGFADAQHGLARRALQRSGRRRPLLVEVVGNPIRAELAGGDAEAAWRWLGVPAEERAPLLLAMGGSLGARQVNQLVEAAVPQLTDDWYVVHQTGRGAMAGPPTAHRYRRVDFLADGLGDLLAAATVVVCRAGANTLGELASYGLPSILVPLPSSQSRGEQARNAEVFAAAGASRVLADSDATPMALVASLRDLKDNPASLAAMRAAARELATPAAAARIAALVEAHLAGGATSNRW